MKQKVSLNCSEIVQLYKIGKTEHRKHITDIKYTGSARHERLKPLIYIIHSEVPDMYFTSEFYVFQSLFLAAKVIIFNPVLELFRIQFF